MRRASDFSNETTLVGDKLRINGETIAPPTTGQPRALQVDQAFACIDFAEDAAGLVRLKQLGHRPIHDLRLALATPISAK
jgi:hypothetical protein